MVTIVFCLGYYLEQNNNTTMRNYLHFTLAIIFTFATLSISAQSDWMEYTTTNSGHIISSIVEEGCGSFWIGTTYGLAFFNGDTWTDYTMKNSNIPSNYVYSLALDTNRGGVWVGSLDSGLAFFDGNSSWTVYTNNNTIPNLSITDIKLDASGNVWIATYYGIAVFNGTKWTQYNSGNSGLATT